jgi:hypothetical protein
MPYTIRQPEDHVLAEVPTKRLARLGGVMRGLDTMALGRMQRRISSKGHPLRYLREVVQSEIKSRQQPLPLD